LPGGASVDAILNELNRLQMIEVAPSSTNRPYFRLNAIGGLKVRTEETKRQKRKKERKKGKIKL